MILTGLKTKSNKEKTKEIAIILIPIIILAIIQMIYNYIRFGNILEFGAKYQLTSFNINTYMGLTFSRFLLGIVEFVFQAPYINIYKFPYVFICEEVESLSLNQFHYDNRLLGTFFVALFWILIFKKHIYKDSKELKTFVNLSIIITIVLMFINASMGGTVEEYAVDFKCLLSLISIILLLRLISMKQSSKEMKTLFIVISVITIVLMIPVSLTTESEYFLNPHNPVTVFFKSICDCWI